ncbi:MAG: GNAT family N-acetyltransferase [Chitinophagales bacterium]
MKIRNYTPADHEKIIALLRLNTPEFFSPTEEDDLVDYLEHHADCYYVIEIDNIILGCGGINLVNDGVTARISWDIIHPNSQGKGLGSALTKFRIQKIKEMEGIKVIAVRTSQMAHQYYAKFGFELKEIIKDYWADGFDLYSMEFAINESYSDN